ncbi:hypothetical protein EVAR_88512_1 [Eumeta japonica]|uniref:Uncharacterized protein n=1 Tax=Eumeta variegata TaxID=151549 RepID=A0A4C1XTS2_EUMVA|nr:hypothetical protein EVAR_88512_1 [Eumeta japonica]
MYLTSAFSASAGRRVRGLDYDFRSAVTPDGARRSGRCDRRLSPRRSPARGQGPRNISAAALSRSYEPAAGRRRPPGHLRRARRTSMRLSARATGARERNENGSNAKAVAKRPTILTSTRADPRARASVSIYCAAGTTVYCGIAGEGAPVREHPERGHLREKKIRSDERRGERDKSHGVRGREVEMKRSTARRTARTDPSGPRYSRRAATGGHDIVNVPLLSTSSRFSPSGTRSDVHVTQPWRGQRGSGEDAHGVAVA